MKINSFAYDLKSFDCLFIKPQISFEGCQYYGFASTLAALAEIWSLAAVSCDRLQAIFHPLDSHKRITKFQVIRQIYISIEELHYLTLICYSEFYFFNKKILFEKANGIIAFVWIFSLSFAIFPLLGWNNYVSEVSSNIL